MVPGPVHVGQGQQRRQQRGVLADRKLHEGARRPGDADGLGLATADPVGGPEAAVTAGGVAVTGLSALARRLAVPYPIVRVVGGAVLGFVPGLPTVELAPEVALVVFLPPLLYGASIYANFDDLRRNLRGLALSTVGLVLATMCAVAWVAHALIPGLPWEAAFVLGAIVSPTDPLAPAVIMRRVDAPRRLVSAIEGEGLFNDATALVAYRVAVAAVVAGASRWPTPASSSSWAPSPALPSESRSGGSSPRSAGAP